MNYALTEAGQQRASEAVRRVLGQGASESRDRRRVRGPTGQRYQGVLDGALAAGSLTTPSTATMTVWLPDPEDDATPPAFIETDIVLDVVNRDPSLAGDAGAFAKVELLNGEWSPYWVGCVE